MSLLRASSVAVCAALFAACMVQRGVPPTGASSGGGGATANVSSASTGGGGNAGSGSNAGSGGSAASGGSAGSGGNTGAGGAGGAAGTGSSSSASGGGGGGVPSFTPPDLPRVVNLGGPVLTHPKIQPIRYSNDPNAADLRKAELEITGSAYWGEVTGEYGVGPATLLPSIVLTSAPPAMIDDGTIQQMIVDNTTGTSPAWGAADPSTVYLIHYPKGSIATMTSGTCCKDFDGYHDEVQISASLRVPYAVTCACGGSFDGPNVTDLEQRTIVMSHELVEAVTDPFIVSNPAFRRTDDASYVWTLVTFGEAGDLCDLDADAFYVPPGNTYKVQRTWSNAAAKAFTNPCVPVPPFGPYYNTFPDQPDMLHVNGVSFTTKGVKIAVGKTATIPVHLWSEAPTSGPWSIGVYDYRSFTGGSPNLKLSLDKAQGQNGDTLALTITVLKQDAQLGVEPFLFFSDLGGQENMALGLVGQN